MADFEYRYEADHSPDEVWSAINTPIPQELHSQISPWVAPLYDGLSRENIIQPDTRINYTPTEALRTKVPAPFQSQIPQDISLRVVTVGPLRKSRLDILDSKKAEGAVEYRVEESESGGGLLVVFGKLSINGLGKMVEGVAIKYGIEEPHQRIIENLSRILKR